MDEIKRSSSTEPMDLFQPNLKTQSTKYLWVKGIPRSFQRDIITKYRIYIDNFKKTSQPNLENASFGKGNSTLFK